MLVLAAASLREAWLYKGRAMPAKADSAEASEAEPHLPNLAARVGPDLPDRPEVGPEAQVASAEEAEGQ